MFPDSGPRETGNGAPVLRHGNPENVAPLVSTRVPFGVLYVDHAGLLMQHLVLHFRKKVQKAGRSFTLHFYCTFGPG